MRSPRHPYGATDVEPIDWTTASDDDVQAYYRLDCAVDRAAGVPESLICPYEAFERYLRVTRPFVHRRPFVVRDGAEFAAVGVCSWEDVEANRDHAWIGVLVAPERRGGGLERALLTQLVDLACNEFSARLIDFEARLDDELMAPFVELGFEVKLRTPRNVLFTKDLNRVLLEEWITKAEERAADYELISFDGPCPDDLAADYVQLREVMNTAPIEDLDWDDETMTVEQLREFEAWDIRRDAVPWIVIARHVPTGELVGFTVIIESRLWPTTAWQGDTGVRPAHRNRGLGRWLKAVNALRLLDERPGVEVVTTWNAGSNEPMLAINHAMGFAPLEWWGEWQAEAKAVRDLLTAS